MTNAQIPQIVVMHVGLANVIVISASTIGSFANNAVHILARQALPALREQQVLQVQQGLQALLGQPELPG